ncbi:MAG: chemotaxis protein CheA, partial [Nannocystaceae bacterium]
MTSHLTALSEIQDLVEEFSRSLLQIEEERSAGRDFDPDLVNGAFRAVHTLKGIASMVEVAQLVLLSHELENCLDDIRLGKRALDPPALDLLFSAVDMYTAILAHAADPERQEPDVGAFIARIAHESASTRPVQRDTEPVSLEWLHEDVRSVLTEYEEFRLRENMGSGRGIFSIHVSFDLFDVDKGIERLKLTIKPLGEVLTYLPSADASRDDRIDLDILVGSANDLDVLRAALKGESVSIERLNTGQSARPSAPEGEVPAKRTHERTRPETAAHGQGDEPSPATPPPPPDASPAEEVPAVGLSPGTADSAKASVPPQSIRSVVQTVRVELSRLDALMNLVGEMRVIQSEFAQSVAQIEDILRSTPQIRTLHDQTRQMARRIDDLRDKILDVRMVPVGQMFDTLARVVRKLSREHGKDVRLVVTGEQTELDKLIVEELSDPLMHMIRNAIDHGIESVERRSAAGKSLTGKISLTARQRGNSVEIQVEDDGEGMDWMALRDRAVARGLLTSDEAEVMSASDALRLIFTPGFSTLDA